MTRPTVSTCVAFLTKPTASTQTWTSVASYHRAINTHRGRQSELDRDEAGTCSVTLKNDDRRFDPTYTSSLYYPYILPMRRIRVGASTVTPYLDCPGSGTSYITTPDSSSLSITGDLDLRAKLAADDWSSGSNQYVLSKFLSGGPGGTSYQLYLTSGGNIGLQWGEPPGPTVVTTNSTVATGFTDGSTHWIRATLDVDNGASGFSVRFYTSEDGEAWTQLGTTVTGAGTTSIQNTTDPVVVGAYAHGSSTSLFTGKIYAAEIRDGIDGTLVSSLDFAAGIGWPGDTSITDAQIAIWTIAGNCTFAGMSPIFSGFVLAWPQSWPNKRNAIVQLSAVDAFHVLALKKITATYSAENSADRVGAVLDDVGWPAGDRDIGTGQSTIIEVDLEDIPALEHLQHVAETEIGRVFIDKAGRVAFLGRHDLIGSSQGTFGDASGELRYIDIGTASYGESPLYNEVRVATTAGTYQEAQDSASQATYCTRTLTRSNMLIADDTEAADMAGFLLAKYKEPRLRFEEMTLDGERGPDTLWPIILDLELGDHITVRRRPPGGGDYIEQVSVIESIDHEIGPGSWRCKLGLSPSSTEGAFTTDDAGRGRLSYNYLVY